MSLGGSEVSHWRDAEDQGRGQTGTLEEIIISIHFSPSFPLGNVSLMFPAFISHDHINCKAPSAAGKQVPSEIQPHWRMVYSSCVSCALVFEDLQHTVWFRLLWWCITLWWLPTVTLVTVGCAMGSSEKVQIEFVDATIVNEKIRMGEWVSLSDLWSLDMPSWHPLHHIPSTYLIITYRFSMWFIHLNLLNSIDYTVCSIFIDLLRKRSFLSVTFPRG